MTDLHTHILYGVDDGSESLEMTLDMLSMASKAGTKNIALTPHCNVPGSYRNYINDVIVGRFEKIKREVRRNNIDINVYLGMEVFGSLDVCPLIDMGAIITLNNSRYMLIEFDFGEDPMVISEILARVQSMGITPLMAHPERYVAVQQYPLMVFDWVESGCLMQLNRGSVMSKFGQTVKDTAVFLLNHNLIHVCASDAHKPYMRTPLLDDAYDYVEKRYGVKRADRLFKINPENILLDKEITKSKIILYKD